MSRVTRKCGSWSMAWGMSTGMFLPASTDGRNAGADCMAVKKIMPMFVLLSKPNTAFAVEKVIFLATSVAMRYSVLLILVIGKDARLLRVEAQRDHVERVLVGEGHGIFLCQLRLVHELLVVGHLEVQRRVEGVLQVLGEHPGHQVAEVRVTGRPTTGVEDELLAGLVAVEHPLQVAVGEEDLAAQREGDAPGETLPATEDVFVDRLGAELLDQLLVVDLAAHVPRRHGEVLVHRYLSCYNFIRPMLK